LRDRPQDIEALANHFASKYAESNGIQFRPLSKDALVRLKQNVWRGNVRELENTIHRAVLLASGAEIGAEAVIMTGSAIETPTSAAASAEAVRSNMVGRTVEAVERDLILDTLSHCYGNRTHAANILGISIRTLRNKLKQYSEEGFPVPAPGAEDRQMA
jgi:DNA-binding NtrC family response regulator